jgi:hypothetical protein
MRIDLGGASPRPLASPDAPATAGLEMGCGPPRAFHSGARCIAGYGPGQLIPTQTLRFENLWNCPQSLPLLGLSDTSPAGKVALKPRPDRAFDVTSNRSLARKRRHTIEAKPGLFLPIAVAFASKGGSTSKITRSGLNRDPISLSRSQARVSRAAIRNIHRDRSIPLRHCGRTVIVAR